MDTKDTDKFESKLLKKCQIQIAESPVQHDKRILPSVCVPVCKERADVTENILRQLEFDTCLNDLQSNDKSNLWNAVARTREAISKLKSMKLDAGLSSSQREIILMTEKFFAKIKLFLLSLFRSDAVPKSVYIDLFTSFLDVCGIVTLSGEMFQRKSLLAGDIYSGSPDLFLLPLNMTDTSLRTVGTLSYTDEEFQSECMANTANLLEVPGKVSQSTSPMEIPNKQDHLSLRAQMTNRWVQNLPTAFDRKSVDEMESSSPYRNLQENALSVQRKRTFEGRIKQPAVKLSPTNAVINKIPIIITLAPDVENSEETTEQQTKTGMGLKGGTVPDSPFQAPGGKLNFPTRLCAGLLSAMEQEFPSSKEALQQQKPDGAGLAQGRIPDTSFQAPGRNPNTPTGFFDGIRSALEQELPGNKSKITDLPPDRLQTVKVTNLTAGRIPDPSFQAPGRKINIPKGLFAGMRSEDTKEKTTESAFAKLLLPVIGSPPKATEARLKDGKQTNEEARNDTYMDKTSCISNEIGRNKNGQKKSNDGTTDNGSKSSAEFLSTSSSDTDTDGCPGEGKIDKECSNEPGTSGICKMIKLEQGTSGGISFEVDHETIRNSAENNQNTSSHVNDCVKCFCKCCAKSDRNGFGTSFEETRYFKHTLTEQNLKFMKKNHYFKRNDQLKIHQRLYYTKSKIRGRGNETKPNKEKIRAKRKQIIKRRKKFYRKKRKSKKSSRKERLSSDSGLPDSLAHTENTDLNFHGRFDLNCQSSDSFPQSYLIDDKYNKNCKNEYPIYTVTQNKIMSSGNIKINSEFIHDQVEQQNCSGINVEDIRDEITRNNQGQKMGDKQNETTCVNRNDTARDNQKRTTTADNQDNNDIYGIGKRTYTCLRSADGLLQQPLVVQETSDSPMTSYFALDKTSNPLDISPQDNCTFIGFNGNTSRNDTDKNVNAKTHAYSPFSVEFIQSLLLEWPNALTKPSSVGLILHKTKVIVAVLEMSHMHYEHLSVDGAAVPNDKAEVNFTHVLDLLQMSDRICLSRVLTGLACVGR